MDKTEERSVLAGKGSLAAAAVLAMVMAGSALFAQPAAAPKGGEATASEARRVPMEVKQPPSWLSWIGATTGCLRALGVECDMADVAGYSGYGFFMNVQERVDVSGPCGFNWGLLLPGIAPLGRTASVVRGFHCICVAKSEEDRESIRGELRAAYDLVAREVEAGRPCVVWGKMPPEFGIAVGVQDGKYLIAGQEEPVPFDELMTSGGAFALGFPSAVRMPREEADRQAVYQALDMLNCRRGDPHYANGQAAYDMWIAALEAGKVGAFGNSYNAQCWAEAKCLARDFLRRVAGRNAAVADALGRAAAAYAEVADAMEKLADLFPFPDSDQRVDDPAVRAEAVKHLRAAKAAEARAAGALAEAAAQWGKP